MKNLYVTCFLYPSANNDLLCTPSISLIEKLNLRFLNFIKRVYMCSPYKMEANSFKLLKTVFMSRLTFSVICDAYTWLLPEIHVYLRFEKKEHISKNIIIWTKIHNKQSIEFSLYQNNATNKLTRSTICVHNVAGIDNVTFLHHLVCVC